MAATAPRREADEGMGEEKKDWRDARARTIVGASARCKLSLR
jgi:hypothetical protein